MKPLPLGAGTRVVLLTGAGVSAESGLSTFRSGTGLWKEHRVEDVATWEAFERDPDYVWSFHAKLRRQILAVEPNAADRALSQLEQRLTWRFLLATQNVDALHTRAGNERVVELHGNLFFTRCLQCGARYYDESLPPSAPRHDCGGVLRPDVVWFGESLDRSTYLSALHAVQQAHYFIAIGTSGTVSPASEMVQVARQFGAITVLVNEEPPLNRAAFDQFYQGAAGDILPALLRTAI